MSKPAPIKPTVGRIVHYRPVGTDRIVRNDDEPLAGIVACVSSDEYVHLHVFDANGDGHSRTGVLMVQDGDPKPKDRGYCEWPARSV